MDADPRYASVGCLVCGEVFQVVPGDDAHLAAQASAAACEPECNHHDHHAAGELAEHGCPPECHVRQSVERHREHSLSHAPAEIYEAVGREAAARGAAGQPEAAAALLLSIEHDRARLAATHPPGP